MRQLSNLEAAVKAAEAQLVQAAQSTH